MDACTTPAPRVLRGDLTALPPSEVATLAAVAHALSDPVRVQILWLLEQRDELCTCEFEELLALGQSRVSYHLRLLLEAGLLVRQRRGTWSHYRLARSGLIECLRALAPHGETPHVEARSQVQKVRREVQGVTHR
jgi:ArsR family transcriptional regulator, arsenate/arsenite/antimonite-responsive transcriptional repressor